MALLILRLLIPSALVACGLAGWRSSNGDDDPAPAARTGVGKEVTGDGQLTAYVRRIFQDSRGRYWFGSNGEGIYRYDGSKLEVFGTNEGLAGSQVTGILEDRNGRIWISTDGGVSRYDGTSFTNYTRKDGLPSNNCWSIFEARDGTIWVGTTTGPCRARPGAASGVDGTAFVPLALPLADMQDQPGFWVACIMQDRSGDLWFATRGGGVFKYNGRSFTLLNTGNGLHDDDLAWILVDSKERVWISSMNAGLAQYDEGVVMRFMAPDHIGDNEVWTIVEDREGHIWFSSERFGVYRYDGSSLRNYSTQQGLGVLAVQSIHQDREGRMWFGGGGGLYRLEGDTMVHVKRNGPWR